MMPRVDMIERLRAWSYRRQGIGDPAATPEEALRAVVAVYATHPTAPLALWARTGSFSAARYRSLDRERAAVRVPAMRNTVFLIPLEHAARIFTAVRPSAGHALKPLARHGISAQAYGRYAAGILDATAEPASRRALQEAAGLEGEQLGTVLRCLRYEGLLLTLAGESLNMSPHRYIAAAAWFPEGLDAGDPGQARAWLAAEYLRAYGPARVADFAWWTGLGKRAATAAVAAHGTVDLGDGLLLPADDLAAFERVRKLRDAVALLPKWDAYTMGHAPDGRRRFVHPDLQRAVYTPIGAGLSGDGNPVVLVDGEVVATWTYTVKDGAQVQPFDRLGTRTRARIDDRLAEVVGLLGS
ncbi:MAG: DNA glycosylase AlkZ-like family protein [Actinomycetota bacterium]